MRKEYKNLLFIVFSLSIYLTILSPLNILIGNYDEFNYGLVAVFMHSILYFVLCFVLLFLPYIIINQYVKKIYFNLLIILLALSVINSQFLFGNYGAFDGRGLDFQVDSIISIAQILIGIALILIVFFSKTKMVIMSFSILLIGVTFMVNIGSLLISEKNIFKKPKLASKDFVSFSKTNPNYLYIILDEIYSGSTSDIFNKNEVLLKNFNGFTNYNNTAAIYPTTIMSLPAILTNQLYTEGQDVNEFYKESFNKSPLIKTLENKEIDYKIHTVGVYKKALPAKSFSSMGTLGVDVFDINNDYYQILNLSIFKALPDTLKSYAYNKGNWIFKKLPSDNKSQYIKEFDYFVENMNNSSDKSTFKLFHTTLTHSPVNHNSDCEFLKKSLPGTYINHISNDTCGFIQVSRILSKLKELNIYDNTYIIISSDHGRGSISPSMLKKVKENEKISATVYGHSHATLMVKPLNSTNEFKSSNEPKSLLDIAPMIISDVAGSKYTTSERKYYHYNWSVEYHDWSKKNIPPFTDVYTIGRDITNFDDWYPDENFMKNIFDNRLEKITSQVFFGKGLNQKQKLYATQGISIEEKWGRWSDSKKAKIIFKIDEKLDNKISLEISVKAFITEKNPLQNAKVLLNGNIIGEIEMKLGVSQPKLFKFDVNNKIKYDNVNILEFQIDNPKTPKSIGFNNDERLLGLGFVSMEFK